MFEQNKWVVARAMRKAGHSVEFIGLVLGVKTRRVDGVCFVENQAIFVCVVCGRAFLRKWYDLRKSNNGVYEGIKTCSGKCLSHLMNSAKSQKSMMSLTSPR